MEKCTEHAKYKGLKRPKCPKCPDCQKVYDHKHPKPVRLNPMAEIIRQLGLPTDLFHDGSML